MVLRFNQHPTDIAKLSEQSVWVIFLSLSLNCSEVESLLTVKPFFLCSGMITSSQLSSVLLLWLVYISLVLNGSYTASQRQLLSHYIHLSKIIDLQLVQGWCYTQVFVSPAGTVSCMPRQAIVVESHCVAPGCQSQQMQYSVSAVLSVSTSKLQVHKYAAEVTVCISRFSSA